jgi:hypothetical protein
MKTNGQMEKQASRIADAIVNLVERTDGYVTCAQIEREVECFAAKGPDSWVYLLSEGSGQRTLVIWDGMTKAGALGLRQVMHERRVAVQFVIRDLYLDRFLEDENWVPIVLLPVRAANLAGPRWLIRAPPAELDPTDPDLKGRFCFLTPGPVRSTADQFSP